MQQPESSANEHCLAFGTRLNSISADEYDEYGILSAVQSSAPLTLTRVCDFLYGIRLAAYPVQVSPPL